MRFRFRLLPFVATIIVMAAGIALAQWQTRRGDEKLAIEATRQARQAEPALQIDGQRMPSDDAEYRHVQLRGEFLRDWPVYLDNRPHDGIAGFYLLMPFKIAGTNLHVLVARGWLPRDPADRTRLPPVITPSGTETIEGTLRRTVGHVMQLGTPEPVKPGAIVQNLDADGFAAASGLRTYPLLVEQSSPVDDGLVRDWPLPSSGVEKHRAYAFQWYALTAMAFLFFVVTGFKRGSKHENQ